MTREERNQLILLLVAKREHSYEVIAQMMNCGRGVVAGVVFRDRYPKETRTRTATRIGGRNMIGTGKRPPGYRPEKTKRDLHVRARKTAHDTRA